MPGSVRLGGQSPEDLGKQLPVALEHFPVTLKLLPLTLKLPLLTLKQLLVTLKQLPLAVKLPPLALKLLRLTVLRGTYRLGVLADEREAVSNAVYLAGQDVPHLQL